MCKIAPMKWLTYPGDDRPPGDLGALRIPIKLWVLLGVLIVLFTGIYHFWVAGRSTITFFGVATGVAAGIVSAYYISRGLKVTISQREQALADSRLAVAFDFMKRWDDAHFADQKAEWRRLIDELENKKPSEICDILGSDHDKRTVTVDILNFFEEVGYSAKRGLADIEALEGLFKSIVIKYYNTAEPWIQEHRTNKPQPTAYEHFEWLRNKWRKP